MPNRFIFVVALLALIAGAAIALIGVVVGSDIVGVQVHPNAALQMIGPAFLSRSQLCAPGPQTFSYTGANQTIPVPKGCTSAVIEAVGAGGGGFSSTGQTGGNGGFSSAEINLKGIDQLIVVVGQGGIGTCYGDCSGDEVPPVFGGGGGTQISGGQAASEDDGYSGDQQGEALTGGTGAFGGGGGGGFFGGGGGGRQGFWIHAGGGGGSGYISPNVVGPSQDISRAGFGENQDALAAEQSGFGVGGSNGNGSNGSITIIWKAQLHWYDFFKLFGDSAVSPNSTSTKTAAVSSALSDPGGTGHGCAVFGANLGALCNDFPVWTVGQWKPPSGATSLHVLVVGGGGGGSANEIQGIGGPGGGSGKVVTEVLSITNSDPIAISVGEGGRGSSEFMQPGENGNASYLGNLTAQGGQGGILREGGSAKGPGGNNGGGGSGGGSYAPGFLPGAGGNGGTGGANGKDGQPATDPNPVFGTRGGSGTPFPEFQFRRVIVSAGLGGNGGTTAGSGGAGCGGGGGGGGGGVLLNDSSGHAASGDTTLATYPCADDRGEPGEGGAGYGAGGGGSGNGYGSPGGDGANGIVYVEW